MLQWLCQRALLRCAEDTVQTGSQARLSRAEWLRVLDGLRTAAEVEEPLLLNQLRSLDVPMARLTRFLAACMEDTAAGLAKRALASQAYLLLLQQPGASSFRVLSATLLRSVLACTTSLASKAGQGSTAPRRRKRGSAAAPGRGKRARGPDSRVPHDDDAEGDDDHAQAGVDDSACADADMPTDSAAAAVCSLANTLADALAKPVLDLTPNPDAIENIVEASMTAAGHLGDHQEALDSCFRLLRALVQSLSATAADADDVADPSVVVATTTTPRRRAVPRTPASAASRASAALFSPTTTTPRALWHGSARSVHHDDDSDTGDAEAVANQAEDARTTLATHALQYAQRSYLHPMLTLTAHSSSTSAVPAAVMAVRDAACEFLRSIAASHAALVRTTLQHALISVPDRAEARRQASLTVCKVLGADGGAAADAFAAFLARLGNNSRAGLRHIAVETAAGMLARCGVAADTQALLLRVIVQRASDKAPAVRAKALTHLADAWPIPSVASVNNLLLPLTSRASAADETEDDSHAYAGITALMQRRASDCKPAVRKAAVALAQQLAQHHGYPEENTATVVLPVLVQRSTDVVLSVRKAALAALTALAQQAEGASPGLLAAWVKAVPALISDAESSMQERAAAAVRDTLLLPLLQLSADPLPAWSLASAAAQDDEALRYVTLAMKALARDTSQLPAPTMRRLVQRLLRFGVGCASRQASAWAMIAAVAQCWPRSITAADLLPHWPATAAALDTQDASHIFAMLSQRVDSMTSEQRQQICKRLSASLASPPWPLASLHAQLELYAAAVPRHADVTQLARQMYACVTQQLSRGMMQSPEHNAEVAPVGVDAAAASPQMLQQCVFVTGELALLQHAGKVPAALSTLIQALAATGTAPMDEALRGHVFVALGKMCVTDRALAKRSMPVFARELETSASPVVRNNIVVVLRDLCVVWTGLVDQYLPVLAACLRDAHVIVRHHAVTVLTGLLAEDYVKWNNGLIYRFMTVLVDANDALRRHALVCLTSVLLPKNTDLLLQHMVEAVYHFNNVTSHPTFNTFIQSDRHRILFNLSGPGQKPRRISVYKSLLATMTPQQRLTLTSRLAQDVLGALVDGVISLAGDRIGDLVQDTLDILALPEMRVQLGSGSGDDAEDDTPDSGPSAGSDPMRDRLLATMERKLLIDNVVPVLVTLKHVMESERSPLLRGVLGYLAQLWRVYKADIKDALAADPVLVKELEYDVAQETARAAKSAARAAAAAKAAAAASIPSASGGESIKTDSAAVSDADSAMVFKTPVAQATRRRVSCQSDDPLMAVSRVAASPAVLRRVASSPALVGTVVAAALTPRSHQLETVALPKLRDVSLHSANSSRSAPRVTTPAATPLPARPVFDSPTSLSLGYRNDHDGDDEASRDGDGDGDDTRPSKRARRASPRRSAAPAVAVGDDPLLGLTTGATRRKRPRSHASAGDAAAARKRANRLDKENDLAPIV